MDYMSLAGLMDKGTPVLLLALLILSVVNTIFVKFLFSAVKGIKKDIIWRDTYNSDQNTVKLQFKDIDRRITRMENIVNNK